MSSSATLIQGKSDAGPVNRSVETQFVRLAVYLSQVLLDLSAICAGFVCADLLRHGSIGGSGNLAILLPVLPFFVIVGFYAGAYSHTTLTNRGRSIGLALMALVLTLAIELIVNFASKDTAQLSRAVFFAGAGLSAAFLILVRLPVSWLVTEVLGSRFIRRVLVVDAIPARVPKEFEIIDVSAYGIKPDVNDPMMLHNFSSLVRGADRVVVSCPPEARANWSIYLKGVGCTGELLLPEMHGVGAISHEPELGVTGLQVSTGPLGMRNRILKRVLDLALTVPAIIVLTPVFLVVALAIKLDSPGPVLFKQYRMGRSNRLFEVYKFRSMRTDMSDANGARSASRDDDRITRVGRFIRATSIDELPQLFNVIEGDMGLVGPRPHALGSLAGSQLFWQVDERYWLRHAIKPGITGLAQVRGFRGATDHEDDLANRLQSDLEYIVNWTIWRDIAIIARTALVLVHKNAY